MATMSTVSRALMGLFALIAGRAIAREARERTRKSQESESAIKERLQAAHHEWEETLALERERAETLAAFRGFQR